MLARLGAALGSRAVRPGLGANRPEAAPARKCLAVLTCRTGPASRRARGRRRALTRGRAGGVAKAASVGGLFLWRRNS
jgi:hypothetical protein